MSNINTSIYNVPAPQPQNPLDTLGKLATTQNALNQNQLFRSNQALNEAVQGSIGPNGQLDPQAFARNIANNPNITNNALEAMQGMQQYQQGQVVLDTQKYNLAKAQMDNYFKMIASVAANPNATARDADKVIAQMVAQRLITTEQAVKETSTMPRNDPKAFREWINGHAAQAASLEQLFQMQHGVQQTVDTASGKRLIRRLPDGRIIDDGAVAETLAPSQEVINERGQKQLLGPSAPGGLMQPGQSAPSQQSQAGKPLITGLEPGSQGSIQSYEEDQQIARSFKQSAYPLEQAIGALERLGKTGTGPGAEELNHIKSFLQTSGAGDLFGIDVNKIKDFDEAKKYLTDWVNQTGDKSTNDKLAAAFEGSPSVKISNAAAVDVAKAALALRRMKQAQILEAQRKDIPAHEYGKWASKWNTDQDARAYGIDIMKPEARDKLFDSLKGKEREKFMNSLRSARATGVVSDGR